MRKCGRDLRFSLGGGPVRKLAAALIGGWAAWNLLVLAHDLIFFGYARVATSALSDQDARLLNLQHGEGGGRGGCRTRVRRFGHRGDGGWDVCLDHINPKACVVYSVGIRCAES